MQAARRIPEKFALKELTAPKPFPLGRNKDIRDYMPLSEAAIQRFLTHTAVVATYWADVRCLHPVTLQPLDVEPDDLDSQAEGSWLPINRVASVEHKFSRAMARLQPSKRIREVRLQMRIAMEYCDLGAPPLATALCSRARMYCFACLDASQHIMFSFRGGRGVCCAHGCAAAACRFDT